MIELFSILNEALIKYIMPLARHEVLELKGVNARRSSKAMAVVLVERFNETVAPFSSSPSRRALRGFQAVSHSVLFFFGVTSHAEEKCLDCKTAESQRYHRLNQSFLKCPQCRFSKKEQMPVACLPILLSMHSM